MASPLTVKRNEYRKNPKRSDIETPDPLAKYIHDTVVQSKYVLPGIVFDIGCGRGNLGKPFEEDGHFTVVGIDTVDAKDRWDVAAFIQMDFLTTPLEQFFTDSEDPADTGPLDLPEMWSLVICNPPFNNSGKRSGKLMPALFMERIFKSFGPSIPLVLFAPMGMRLNQRMKSSRWRQMRDNTPKITSILSLPLNIFIGVEFHSEVLFFNMPDLDTHYFLPENVITEIRSSRNE